MASKNKFDRQGFLVKDAMERSTNSLAAKLKPEFSAGDRSNMSKDEWSAIIRQNWSDPQWRAAKAKQYGDTSFVRDAFDAFGIPQSALQSDATPTDPGIDAGLNIGNATATSANATI